MKALVEEKLYELNRELLEANYAVPSLIARCMRFRKEERIPTADALLREIRVLSLRLADDLRGRHVWETVEDIKRECKDLEDRGERFFSGVVHAAADELSMLIADLRAGVFELTGGHEAISCRLCMALSLLEKGDSFITFSVPALWSTESLGVKGRLLDMERMLVKEGVRVKHVFLMCGQDRVRGSEAERILRARTPITDPRTDAVKYTNPAVYFRVVTPDERDSARREGWHEGFIMQQGSVTGMQFVYSPTDVLRTIRLVREARTVGQVEEKLANEINQSELVEKWFNRT